MHSRELATGPLEDEAVLQEIFKSSDWIAPPIRGRSP
jgi:hypothetical protein